MLYDKRQIDQIGRGKQLVKDVDRYEKKIAR